MTRRATKLKEFRQAHEFLLVLDAGDSLVGDRPYSQQSQGATSVEAMNRLGYDAAALGPKDLGLGAEILSQRIAEADYMYLAANVAYAATGEPVAGDVLFREMGGHGVAIIGLTEKVDAPGFTVADPVETLQKLLPDVRSRADIIIVLTHLPVSAAREMAAVMPDIDLIVAGGSEHLAAGEEIGGRTLIVHADVPSPGHAGRNLGLAQLGFDSRGRMTAQTNEVVALSEVSIEEDPELLEWLLGVQLQ